MAIAIKVEQLGMESGGVLLNILAMDESGATAYGTTLVDPSASVASIHEAMASAARDALQAAGANVTDTTPVTIFGGVVKA